MSPYAVKGNTVVKADSGKVVGHSSNPKKYIRVLRAVEHGWRPTNNASRKRAMMLSKKKAK